MMGGGGGGHPHCPPPIPYLTVHRKPMSNRLKFENKISMEWGGTRGEIGLKIEKCSIFEGVEGGFLLFASEW